MWISFARDHFYVAWKRYSWGFFFHQFYKIFPDPTHVIGMIGQFCARDKVCDV